MIPTRPEAAMKTTGCWVFSLTILVCLLGLARVQRYYGTIYHGWDAQFYYAVARSVVVDQDLDITNDLEMTPSPKPFDPKGDGSFSAAPRHTDGRIWSKYPIGMSLVEAPLIAVGVVLRRILEACGYRVQPAIGYSAVEVWTVAVGLVVLFSASVSRLFLVLARWHGIPAALLGVSGCWLGTSLLHYSAVFPFMAHAMSFALLVFVMDLAGGLRPEGAQNRRIAWLGVCAGAIFLVRPQQVVVFLFLLPILIKMIQNSKANCWVSGAIIGSMAGLAAVAGQIAFNSYQTGFATLSGYAIEGEGFSWLAPQFSIVLTSPSRGLFVYSPIVAVAVLGYIFFRQAIPAAAWAGAANAVVQTYLIAAWSSPEQGESFGARMLSDNAAAVAVGLSAAAYSLPVRWRWLVYLATMLAVTWTTFLMVRYAFGH